MNIKYKHNSMCVTANYLHNKGNSVTSFIAIIVSGKIVSIEISINLQHQIVKSYIAATTKNPYTINR